MKLHREKLNYTKECGMKWGTLRRHAMCSSSIDLHWLGGCFSLAEAAAAANRVRRLIGITLGRGLPGRQRFVGEGDGRIVVCQAAQLKRNCDLHGFFLVWSARRTSMCTGEERGTQRIFRWGTNDRACAFVLVMGGVLYGGVHFKK